jgi:hypothetical protein
MITFVDELIKPIKHHLLTVAFVAGFVVDNLTLGRVDRLFDNIVLASYVVIAILSILYFYAGTSGRLSERVMQHAGKWAPMAMQYAFGGLMSGLLVFYSRSGSWWTSWPYLLMMLAVIFGNECIKKRSERLVFTLSLLFVCLFSYAVLIVPVVLGKMSDVIFVASGAVALAVFWATVRLLYIAVPNFMSLNTRSIIFTTSILFCGLNALYFTNLIPPIPLSMKEMGIYHAVEKRTEGGYVLTYEKGPWYALWRHSDNVFHYARGNRVYCYASVFAPTRFKTSVTHRWEYYDESVSAWTSHDTITFPIDGGRGEGYRGFSFIENVRDGAWRCSVENTRGQVIGRTNFSIVTGIVPQPLVTRVDL